MARQTPATRRYLPSLPVGRKRFSYYSSRVFSRFRPAYPDRRKELGRQEGENTPTLRIRSPLSGKACLHLTPLYPTQHLSKAVKGRSIGKDTPPVLPYSREKGRADGVRIKEQPDRLQTRQVGSEWLGERVLTVEEARRSARLQL